MKGTAEERQIKRQKNVIPGTSRLVVNANNHFPGSSIISLDTPVHYNHNASHLNENSQSMIFTLDHNNHLSHRKQDIPGTSTIRISNKKSNYINSDTEGIKFPELSGKRLFQVNKKSKLTTSINNPNSRHSNTINRVVKKSRIKGSMNETSSDITVLQIKTNNKFDNHYYNTLSSIPSSFDQTTGGFNKYNRDGGLNEEKPILSQQQHLHQQHQKEIETQTQTQPKKMATSRRGILFKYKLPSAKQVTPGTSVIFHTDNKQG